MHRRPRKPCIRSDHRKSLLNDLLGLKVEATYHKCLMINQANNCSCLRAGYLSRIAQHTTPIAYIECSAGPSKFAYRNTRNQEQMSFEPEHE